MTLNIKSVFNNTENSSNDFFNEIIDKAVVSYPIASISGEVNVTNTVDETIAHQITIPANSAINGIHIRSLVALWVDGADLTDFCTFRIRVGTAGTTADTQFFYYRIYTDTALTGNFFSSEWLDCKVTGLNWSIAQIVSISIDHASANVDISGYVFNTQVEGF
jgi:hypothetical protein